MTEASEQTVVAETPVEEVVTETPKQKKPRKAPFTLATILDATCGNPDNFKQFEAWDAERMERVNSDDEEIANAARMENYPGWMRYEITVHCVTFTVIAKKHTNGGYHIRDYIVRDH